MADSKGDAVRGDDADLSIYFDDEEMSIDEENFVLPRENLVWIFDLK